jgi:hypothetical protein
MIDVTSNTTLIMGIYLKSHQSCLQIKKYCGRGGGPLMLSPWAMPTCPPPTAKDISVKNLSAFFKRQ